MSEQLSLLEWRPPAEILAFPSHRSHGATIAVARSIVNLETSKRSGRLNSLRAQTRKRLEPLLGFDAADIAADNLIRAIKVGFAYCENSPLHKQKNTTSTVISFVTGDRVETYPHGYGAGEASACVPRPQALARPEGTEYDAARAREEGAA